MRTNHGFSLTELAISLAVIALLIAAVTQSAGIIRSAQMRTVVTEFSEKQSWVNSFRARYDELPGDFTKAERYWDDDGDGTTEDGDGNTEISFCDTAATPDVYEGYRAWQHLTFTGVTEGQFSGGPADPTADAAVPGTDVPASEIQNAGYFFDYDNADYGITDSNILVLGMPAPPTGGTALTLNGALTPVQASLLDAKLDDSMPDTGSFRSIDGNGSSAGDCMGDNGSGTNIYNQNNDERDCTVAQRLSTE